ncbi:toprim domain-containing protein [Butyricimonas paravirosa]|uniref:hypothetical protein n=1 Tax=Butyricimonas paravirosa TaxID=1472417 RepID=UPI0022E8BBF3|nr:hypothetical protein [Butyricimonas paravirosa]
MAKVTNDDFTRQWITGNAIEIIGRYLPGELTLRGLHYQLVSIGMTNSLQHYKRVVKAMEVARWEGAVDFEAFSDLDRVMVGETRAEITDVLNKIEEAKYQVSAWMKHYSKNRWENQPVYAELFIEKKALQGVFQSVCAQNGIALGACKGYPSLTFLYEAAQRFSNAYDQGKECVILYFGDYDPSGEDIPRSVADNLNRMARDVNSLSPFNVEVKRFALFESQVREWKLPPAPAKETDSRTANWEGIGQVELDAVKPEKLKRMAQEAIDSIFDYSLYDDLLMAETEETETYRTALLDYVNNL